MTTNTPEPILQFLVFENSLFYRGKVYKITDEDLVRIRDKTPDIWWTDSDQVMFFTYYSDGTYFCEKKREIFDFKNNITVKKVYEFVEPTLEQAKEWYEILIAELESIRMEQLRNSKEEVKARVLEEGQVLRTTLENYRNQLLKKCDWTQLPDVPFSEEVRGLWQKYRQYLRDITEDENWHTNNFFLVDFPKAPYEYLDIDPNQENEYLSVPEHFNNYGANTVKLKLARLLDYLASPELTSEASNPTYLAGEDLKLLYNTPYEQFLGKINKYLSRIDPELKYEIVFVEQPDQSHP